MVRQSRTLHVHFLNIYMFFVLSKTLSYLSYPLSLCFLALLAVLLFYRRNVARWLLLLTVIGLYVLSIPFTADRLMHGLEGPRVAPVLGQLPYDAVVVLTGMLDLELSTSEALEFGSGVDRILVGIDLVKRGIGKRLIISGGSGSLWPRASEGELLGAFARQWGLSADQVVVEGTSRNTYENAVNTTALLQSNGYRRFLLITSAFHMRRAAAAFRVQGMVADLYPVDFRAGKRLTPFSFLPSAGGLHGTTVALREWVGRVVYRWQGYN